MASNSTPLFFAVRVESLRRRTPALPRPAQQHREPMPALRFTAACSAPTGETPPPTVLTNASESSE